MYSAVCSFYLLSIKADAKEQAEPVSLLCSTITTVVFSGPSKMRNEATVCGGQVLSNLKWTKCGDRPMVPTRETIKINMTFILKGSNAKVSVEFSISGY